MNQVCMGRSNLWHPMAQSLQTHPSSLTVPSQADFAPTLCVHPDALIHHHHHHFWGPKHAFKKWRERPSPLVANTSYQAGRCHEQTPKFTTVGEQLLGLKTDLRKAQVFLQHAASKTQYTLSGGKNPFHLYNVLGLCCQLPMMTNKSATENNYAHLCGAFIILHPLKQNLCIWRETISTLHSRVDCHCGGWG